MYKSICTASTSMNSTETTKTLIDTITVPQGVKALVGVGCNVWAGTSGTTTVESIGGVLELESDDMSPWGGTQQFLTPATNGNGAGWGTLSPFLHPTNIPVTAGAHIKVSATMDLALTINNKVRAQLVFE